METLAKTFLILVRQNQFTQENFFNLAPVRRIAFALNKNSAFTGSYFENPFWCQQFMSDKLEYLEEVNQS